MTEEEEWRPVVGYEGLYEVSSLGRVRSLDRVVHRPHTGPYKKQGRTLVLQEHRQGYRLVDLYRDGERRVRKVHRLVAEAFLPNPNSLPVVLHGRLGVSSNAVSNLRWGTQTDNLFDTVRDGRHGMARRTHCPQGHEYTRENTYSPPGTKARACRQCRRENVRRHREKRQESKNNET